MCLCVHVCVHFPVNNAKCPVKFFLSGQNDLSKMGPKIYTQCLVKCVKCPVKLQIPGLQPLCHVTFPPCLVTVQVVLEAVKLAVALLKGGHREVQESFWRYLSRSSSEDFFKEIHAKFQEAQAEIKNSPVGFIITQEVSGWAWSEGGCGQRVWPGVGV